MVAILFWQRHCMIEPQTDIRLPESPPLMEQLPLLPAASR